MRLKQSIVAFGVAASALFLPSGRPSFAQSVDHPAYIQPQTSPDSSGLMDLGGSTSCVAAGADKGSYLIRNVFKVTSYLVEVRRGHLDHPQILDIFSLKPIKLSQQDKNRLIAKEKTDFLSADLKCPLLLFSGLPNQMDGGHPPNSLQTPPPSIPNNPDRSWKGSRPWNGDLGPNDYKL